jgi:hypothetical protein
MTIKFDRKKTEFGSVAINGIRLSYKQLFARNMCACVRARVSVRACACVRASASVCVRARACVIRVLVFVCERERGEAGMPLIDSPLLHCTSHHYKATKFLRINNGLIIIKFHIL